MKIFIKLDVLKILFYENSDFCDKKEGGITKFVEHLKKKHLRNLSKITY